MLSHILFKNIIINNSIKCKLIINGNNAVIVNVINIYYYLNHMINAISARNNRIIKTANRVVYALVIKKLRNRIRFVISAINNINKNN